MSKATFGPVYDEKRDGKRLRGQRESIRVYMLGSGWRTLAQIEDALGPVGFPQASISAQLRHLERAEFGAHIKEKRWRKDKVAFEYRLSRPSAGRPVQERLFEVTG